MSHREAINDAHWTNMVNVMMNSVNSLTNQLAEATERSRKLEEKLTDEKEKYEKKIEELTKTIEEYKKKENVDEEQLSYEFDFDEIKTRLSYGATFFKRVCKEIIKKYSLVGGTNEEKIASLRRRDQAAKEILQLCGFKKVNKDMMVYTRKRIASMIAESRFYETHKEDLKEKRSRKKIIIAVTPLLSSTAIPPLLSSTPNVTEKFDFSVENDVSVTVENSDVPVPVSVPVVNITNSVSDEILSTTVDDDFNPNFPSKLEDISVRNIVAVVFNGEERDIYYGEVLRKRQTTDLLKIKYYEEKDGKLFFPEKPNMAWGQSKYVIFTNVTLIENKVVEIEEINRRYVIYKKTWF